MALACQLPATLLSIAIGSRASTGSGPTGVAETLRRVLQAILLQTNAFFASATPQRLQHLPASRVHMRVCGAASGRTYTRGLGPVASVASVANEECIYKSITYSATPAATGSATSRQGVAAFACLLGSAALEPIKYPRIFKGLGLDWRAVRQIGRNGVFGARASSSRRAGGRASAATRHDLDQAETGHFGPSSPVEPSPVGADRERYQHVAPRSRLTVRAKRGAASRQNRPPRSAGDPTPRIATAPSSVRPFGAPVAPRPVFPAGCGENGDRPETGARVAGARGQGAAKTCALVKAGSGEFSHG